MDEKIYDLLEKLYIDLNTKIDKMDGRLDRMDDRFDQIDGRLDQMDDRFDQMDGRLDRMDDRFDNVESIMATKQDIARLEDKMDKNFKALFDGYHLTYEKCTEIDKKVDIIDSKVEKHDVEIRVIKGAANA
jgi:predicted nuclease with TOPRIM domain